MFILQYFYREEDCMFFLKKYDRLNRLRIQFPSLDEKRLSGLEKTLNQMDSICTCEANYVTGSLTIHYDEGCREKVLSYLSALKRSEIPVGNFNANMIKKDIVQRTAQIYAKKALMGLLFPKAKHIKKCFR